VSPFGDWALETISEQKLASINFDHSFGRKVWACFSTRAFSATKAMEITENKETLEKRLCYQSNIGGIKTIT